MSLREWQLGIAILIAFAAAAYAQILVTGDPYSIPGWALYAFGCLLLVLASPRRLFQRIEAIADSTPPFGVKDTIVCLVAIMAVTAATIVPSTRFPPSLALLSWAGSLVLVLVVARGRTVSEPRTASGWSTPEIAAFTAVLALAALARFTWIDSLPGRYFDDEARVGLYVREAMRKGGVPDIFGLGWNSWPALGLMTQGALGLVAGMSTTTLRLTSAMFGTMAVAATYLAARHLFSPPVALAAAFLLAINRTAIDISRMGTCHAQVMALAPLAFALWWRGINTGAASSYIGAGMALGLCLYTYNAGQLVIVVWLTSIAFAALSRRNRSAYARGAVLTFLALCLTISPLTARVTDNLSFGPRWQEWLALGRGRQVVSSLAEDIHKGETGAAVAFLRDQVSSSWLGYFALPSRAYSLGYRNGGMSDDVTAALFVLGLALSVFGRLGARGDFVFCWWAVTTLLGGVLTHDPPTFQRLVGVLPAVAILAALPIELALAWARDSSRKLMLAVALATACAAVAVAQNWRTYFVEFAQQPLDFPSLLARTVNAVPRDRAVILSGGEYAWNATGWLQNQLSFHHELMRLDFSDRELREAPDTADVLPIRLDSGAPPVIVFGPTQIGQANYVRSLYPGASVRIVGQEPHVLAVAEIAMPEIQAMSGLRLRRESSPGAVDLGVRDPFAMQAVDCDGAEACSFEWSGSIRWPSSAPTDLRLTGAGIDEVRVAGTALPLANQAPISTVRVQLPRGWQPFSLRQSAHHGQPWSVRLRVGGNIKDATRADFIPDTGRHGLSATYERHGRRLEEAIEPQLNYVVDERFFDGRRDLPRHLPFDARWRGQLRIDTAGVYEIELQAAGNARVKLDGQLLVVVTDAPDDRVAIGKITRQLDAGLHPIEASWEARPPWESTPIAAFQLYWQRPGGEREIVPPTNFVPDAVSPVISASGNWCDNDCGGDGAWTVDELIRITTVAIGIFRLESCSAADTSKDGQITVDEVVAAVGYALDGCP